MSNQQQFGDWKVIETLKIYRCYLVKKDGKGPLHVLKTANKNGWLAHETENDRYKRQVGSIRKEIEALKRLADHPNIITIVDYDSEAAIPWHVTEYCSGGDIFQSSFDNWNEEELRWGNFHDKLAKIAKAIGYANSQGISLGRDIEVFINKDKRFVIGDLENANIWEDHHIDTTDEIKAFTYISDHIKERAERARRQKIKDREKQREVERRLDQAQPSAPRRLKPEQDPSIGADQISRIVNYKRWSNIGPPEV